MEVFGTKEAARILGVPSDKLRRWVREGKFDFTGRTPPVPGPTADPESPFQLRRLYTRPWIIAVADELGRKPRFDLLERIRA